MAIYKRCDVCGVTNEGCPSLSDPKIQLVTLREAAGYSINPDFMNTRERDLCENCRRRLHELLKISP